MANGLGNVRLHLVQSMDEVAEFKRWLGERRSILAVDSETQGLQFWKDRIRLVQFGDTESAWAIPWDRWAGCVHEALEQYEGEIVLHNASFDAHMLRQWGGIELPWHRVHDTMLLAHINAPDEPVGLKDLSSRLVDPKAAVASRVLDSAMAQQKWTWATIPVDFGPYWQYAGLDCVLTAHVYEHLRPVAEKYHRVYDLERAVLRILFEMEHTGIRIDVPYVERTLEQMIQYAATIEAWCKDTYGVEPGSNQKVAAKLIDLGVELTERTATGAWKLDKSVLTAAGHPLAEAVYRRRRAQKLASTYLASFLESRDGDRIHINVRQLGARTGRQSIPKPALQTLPRGNIIRSAFVPDDSNDVLLSADYDQVEFRILAHFSGDERMIEGISYGDQMRAAGYNGYDLHSMNARGIFGIPFDQPVPKRQRDTTKNAGFARAYLAGVERFSATAGVPVEVGKAFLAQYDATFPGVQMFQRRVERVVMEREYRDGTPWVQTPLGRYLPGKKGKEYALVNYIIQSSASDVFKEGLVRLDAAGLGEFIRVPVHDEVVFSVPNESIDETRQLIQRSMEDRQNWRVPLTVECSEPLPSWGAKYAESEFDAAEMVYEDTDV